MGCPGKLGFQISKYFYHMSNVIFFFNYRNASVVESSVLSVTCMSPSSLSDSGTFEEEEAERLYKSEVVGDFEETVCFGHNREIPRKNSQEF